MSMFKNYSPRHILLSAFGQPILNFAPGTFVKLSRRKPSFTLEMGAGGDGTRVGSEDKSGSIEITIMTASPTNDFLSGIMLLDERTMAGHGPFFFKDLNSASVAKAAQAWLTQPAELQYGDEHGSRVWMLETHDLRMFAGGSRL